jgi:ABC-type branched-chain amino acid transport systems, periplasmic component
MKKWGKKVYVIAADYNYGQITSQWVKKYVTENGGEVPSIDFFPLDVTNFGPTISKIQAAKPDFVWSAWSAARISRSTANGRGRHAQEHSDGVDHFAVATSTSCCRRTNATAC